MQFMPATWQQYGIDANGDGRRDIRDPEDAISSAAGLLRTAAARRPRPSRDRPSHRGDPASQRPTTPHHDHRPEVRHFLYTASGTISNHALGRAVDIAAVNGSPRDGSRIGACGQLAIELVRLPAAVRPTELIYAFDADGHGPNAFADPVDHSDHVHVGFDG